MAKIQVKRVLKSQLPTLSEGEFGFCTDTTELYIGSNTGNLLLAKKSDIESNSKTTAIESSTNGNIVIDGLELQVYDETALVQSLEEKIDLFTLNEALKGKADIGHEHTVEVTTSLDGLSDVDLSTNIPLNGNVLVYENGVWKPKDINVPMISHKGSTYVIELEKWGIKNDGTDPDATAQGINKAVQWAKESGYNHAYLPSGQYFVRIQVMPREGNWTNGTESCVVMIPNDFHFELDRDAVIELESNSWSSYNIILFQKAINSRISGGKIIGDRKTHTKELYLTFERGGVNPDGSLNDDSNWIRTPLLDRLSNGILSLFRVWKPEELTNSTGYHFTQYLDSVSTSNFVGYRDNGLYAPSAPTGRGWFGSPDKANKMIVAINIENDPLTDQQLSNLRVKVDNQYYTHEGGACIGVYGGFNVEVDHMELCNGTGDGITTGVAYKYRVDGIYSDMEQLQKDMGRFIYIHHNNIHRNRRQGISLCGPNDQFVYENEIHHIGKDDDGVTPDFTAPAFGIDIESMIGESNVPAKHLYYGRDGVEVNFRINILNNHIHHNERGHFVNPDGSYVTVENNIFEGYNIGGVSSDARYRFVKFINNTYIGCEQWVFGDQIIKGAVIEKGNLRIGDSQGALITNIKINDGLLYGNSSYGYFGEPIVDVATSTFTISSPHGMGNSAKVSFESWVGKVPKGIVTNKIYYVINQSTYSFQVSETEGGDAVVFYDSGEPGFIVSRYNYGRLFIDGVTIERDYRSDTPGFSLSSAGGSIKNVTVKNCGVEIQGSRNNYVGRPIEVDGLTVIEASTQLSNCQLSNGKFLSSYGDTLSLGTSGNYNKFYGVSISDSTFTNQKLYLGEGTINSSVFKKTNFVKENNNHRSIIANNFIEDSEVNLTWVSYEKVLLFTGCILTNFVTNTGSSNPEALQMIGNTNIDTYVVDKTSVQIIASPDPGVYSTEKSISLTCDQAASIRYTVDDSVPNSSSTLYTESITISSPTVLKAIALNSNSTIIASKSWFYDVDLIAPDNVEELTATSINNNLITLTWKASTSEDVVSYEVFNGNALVQTVTSTTVTLMNLLAETEYTLYVKAVDDAGNKSEGVAIKVTTGNDNIPPEEVSNILVSHVSDTNIGLTWVASPTLDIHSYEVYDGEILLGESISSNFAISNLLPSTSYTFTIKGKDKNGNVSTGVPFTVSTSSTPTTSFSGYVKDGLVLFEQDVLAGIEMKNKNSYFVGTGDFTFSTLLKHESNTTLISRRVLGSSKDSTFVATTANWGTTGAYVQAHIWVKNLADGSYRQHSISTNDFDMQGKMEPGAYYMMTFRRQGNNIKIFLNGIDYTVLAPVSNLNLDSTYNYINGDATTSLTLGLAQHASFTHIKAVSYYNRALPADEITQNFQSLFDTIAPQAISGLTAVSNSPGVIELNWIDSTDPDVLYKNVYYKKSTDSTWIKANASRISSQSYQIVGLDTGIVYDVKVEVVDTSLNKTGSSVVQVTPL